MSNVIDSLKKFPVNLTSSKVVPSSEMFLRNSIEHILNDKDIKKKEHASLKKACESALEELNAEMERYAKQSSGGILPTMQEYIPADAYFHPFELACQSKSPRIIATSLDCLQKLIAYGHLIGDTPDPGDPEKLLIDRIVEAICFPFQGPQTDDIVQLQIIKAILAVILSNTTKAHDRSLLLAVRTCFNIYLATRNQVNQSTAKGTLTQAINSVFNAMARQEQMDQNIELDLDELVVKSVLDSIINQVVASENATNHHKDSNAGLGQNSPTQQNSILSVSSLSVENLADHLPNTMDDGQRLDFKTPEERDAFLIFRALCRLSMKNLPETPDAKSHELRSKLLSLEMILLVLQNFNTPLSEKHTFVYAIRTFLCVALTQNAVSPIIPVFEKALAIFVQLMNKFRVHLKRQMEVFFKEIILSILESSSSSFEHKWIVMHTISKICDNSQAVVDIYINYDCHLTSANIFESLVSYLSKIATTIPEPTQNSTLAVKEREKKMRELGLECLVKILKCLVTFYDEVNFGKNGELSIRNGIGEDDEITTENINAVQFEQLKQQKSIIERGIDLFEKKPEQGLPPLFFPYSKKPVSGEIVTGPTFSDSVNYWRGRVRENPVPNDDLMDAALFMATKSQKREATKSPGQIFRLSANDRSNGSISPVPKVYKLSETDEEELVPNLPHIMEEHEVADSEDEKADFVDDVEKKNIQKMLKKQLHCFHQIFVI